MSEPTAGANVLALDDYRVTAEAIPAIVFIADPQWSIEHYNRQFYEYTGTKPGAHLGSGWMQLVHPDDLQRVVSAVMRSLGEPGEIAMEYRLRRRDGAYRWHVARALPARDAAGRILRWIGSAVDIEEQKLAEERERDLARRLQRELMPPRLPQTPYAALSSVYLPAEIHASVGGDWYDAFHVGGDALAVSIGDVEGHAVEAAVTMAQTRLAIRTAALIDPDPLFVLAHTDSALLSNAERMVTAFYAVFDPRTRMLRYAGAGHPPALLADSGGNVTPLTAKGLPLGVMSDPPPRSAGEIRLEAGMTLVLYTDGLLEHSRDIDAAEEALYRALREGVHRSAHPARDLAKALLPEGHGDDVAVLTMTVYPDGAAPLHAQPALEGLDAGQRARLLEQARAARAMHDVWVERIHRVLHGQNVRVLADLVKREDLCPIGTWLA